MRIKYLGSRAAAGDTVDYLLDKLEMNKKDARILIGNGVDLSIGREDPLTCASNVTRSFQLQARMRPGVTNPLVHLTISYQRGESVSDSVMEACAIKVLKGSLIDRDNGENEKKDDKQKLNDIQYIVVRHSEKGHQHGHILVNMISATGKLLRLARPLWENFREISLRLNEQYNFRRGRHRSLTDLQQKSHKYIGEDIAKQELAGIIFRALCSIDRIDQLPQAVANISRGKARAVISGGDAPRRILYKIYDDKGKQYRFDDHFWDSHFGYYEICELLSKRKSIFELYEECEHLLKKFDAQKKKLKFKNKYLDAAAGLKRTLLNFKTDIKNVHNELQDDFLRVKTYATMIFYSDLAYYRDELKYGLHEKELLRQQKKRQYQEGFRVAKNSKNSSITKKIKR